MAKQQINTKNVKIGKRFENQVYYQYLLKKFPNYTIESNVYFPDLGVELDFVGKKDSDAIEWVAEVKGGDGKEWNKGGGARRTDNVKKAVQNLTFAKKGYPNIKTLCFFTREPRAGNSSDVMLKNAVKWNFIDEIIYLTPESEDNLQTVEEFFHG